MAQPSGAPRAALRVKVNDPKNMAKFGDSSFRRWHRYHVIDIRQITDAAGSMTPSGRGSLCVFATTLRQRRGGGKKRSLMEVWCRNVELRCIQGLYCQVQISNFESGRSVDANKEGRQDMNFDFRISWLRTSVGVFL